MCEVSGWEVRQDVLAQFGHDFRDGPAAVFEVDHQLINADVLPVVQELQ
jgi:hypothetical protein